LNQNQKFNQNQKALKRDLLI